MGIICYTCHTKIMIIIDIYSLIDCTIGVVRLCACNFHEYFKAINI